jgi:class 3 adenylate cyclase
MRFRANSIFLFLVFCFTLLFSNYSFSAGIPKDSVPTISLNNLSNTEISISITKRKFPGLNLDTFITSKYNQGDSVSFSALDFDDRNWSDLINTEGNAFAVDKIYWSRMKFRVSPELLNKTLSLYVKWQGAMEVFLNGELIYSFGSISNKGDAVVIQDAFHIPLRKVLVTFKDSDASNILAFRFAHHSNIGNLKIKESLSNSEWMSFSLHTTEAAEHIDTARSNTLLYYGFFFGTNCIILLLTIFQVNKRYKNKTLLLFSCFTFFTASVAVTNFIELGAFQITTNAVVLVHFFNQLFYALATFFLLHVMRSLFDARNRFTPYVYLSLVVAYLAIGYFEFYKAKNTSTFTFLILLISSFEIVRMSFLSFKNRVQGGWIIIIGSLVFIIAGPVLEQLFNSFDSTKPFVVTICNRISFYLSLPISLSIFLARQSVTNNLLLARQRDELDLEVQERTKELRLEKQKSDDLLLNILPEEVANELKEKGRADAKQFDMVTVMFTDFKGFTKISERLSPSQLVEEIHICFKAFDAIIARHNIEKIKTIGDAYMCAGGLPVSNETHAIDVVNAAIEIRQFMQEHLEQKKLTGQEVFEIRIGIHTGPVVAGIVGIRKFAYDIWGDTVNIASRLESSGEAGKINISGSTYECVKDHFSCTYRGKIEAKNKGQIDMYFVENVSLKGE